MPLSAPVATLTRSLSQHRAQDIADDDKRHARRLESRSDTFDARRDPAVKLPDDGFLAPDAGDDMAGAEHGAADMGLASNHPVAADQTGQDVLMAEPVLERQHSGFLAH